MAPEILRGVIRRQVCLGTVGPAGVPGNHVTRPGQRRTECRRGDEGSVVCDTRNGLGLPGCRDRVRVPCQVGRVAGKVGATSGDRSATAGHGPVTRARNSVVDEVTYWRIDATVLPLTWLNISG